MPNHSIPVINKENITDEERTRLLNRQKCRQYRDKHRDEYREYQRAYREANRTRPSVLHHKWKAEIVRLQGTVAKWEGINTSVGQTYAKRAKEKIAVLQRRIAHLNYTEVNTPGSV